LLACDGGVEEGYGFGGESVHKSGYPTHRSGRDTLDDGVIHADKDAQPIGDERADRRPAAHICA